MEGKIPSKAALSRLALLKRLRTPFFDPKLATLSACNRSQKRQNCLKLLGEGAKRVLGLLAHVDHKSAALMQNRVALVQNRVAMVERTLGRPFLQLAKPPFAPCLPTLAVKVQIVL